MASVGCQLRQCSFNKELPHEHQHQQQHELQQPDELLPPIALDWATALLVVATGILEADHEKRAGDFGPYFWGIFWGCLVSQLHF